MGKERKLINEEVRCLQEAVAESLSHVSKDMLGLKTIIDNLQKEIVTLKTNHTVKTESLKREILMIKTSVNKVAKSVKNIPTPINETHTKRKDNIEGVISEMEKINFRIDKIENKLKM